MTTELLAFVIVMTFLALTIIFSTFGRGKSRLTLRDIPAFSRLTRAVGLSVEDGTRLHLSLGHGDITSPRSAAGFAGLSILKQISKTTADSDRPPIASSGDGMLAILSQDTMRGGYRTAGVERQYHPDSGRLTGVTPFSYAAGTIPIIQDENVSANVLIGSFGSEALLITDASEQNDSILLAGTDNIPAQAILFAASHEPLIGEEIYAGGAYLEAGPMHRASLLAQDVIRWMVITAILGGAILKLLESLP